MITLKTLPQATAQEVFDQVAVHMLTQNAKSLKPGTNSCAYRGANGSMCAAGCLIADDEYNSNLDGTLPEGNIWTSLVEQGLVPEHDTMRLIRMLQTIHDNREVDQWAGQLRHIAHSNNLNADVICQMDLI